MALYTKMIGRRTLEPIIWNIMLQGSLLSFFIFITNVNIIHPVKWLYDWYLKFVWLASWMYILPLAVMVILLASASTEDYLKIQPFYPNRISLLRQALTFHNILIGFLHFFIGFLISWTYSSLLDDNHGSFLYYCEYVPDEYCFSEKRYFLIEAGIWISVLYFFHSHFFGTRYLKFPIAQLPKFILIKGLFFDTFKTSLQWIIIPDVSFIVIYYLKIGSLNSYLAEFLGYKIEEEHIDTFSGLFDLGLITYLVIFSVIIVVSMRFMEMFSRIYLTERFCFPFSAAADKSPTLTEALKMSDYPILQHLAFLDLMLLSNHSQTRREEIFKLSSFGGHPHLWNGVKEGCTNLVVEFIGNLEENMSTPSPLNPVEQNLHPSIKRNVTDYFAGYEKKFVSTPVDQKRTPTPGHVYSFAEKIKKSPIVFFIFGSRKDMKIRHTLRLCSLVKWACESLSFLSCHSVKEDKYGIVVNDLHDIIILLLQLKQTLENLLKRTALSASLSLQDLENIAEATALKKSVKRSIYRIVNTFKNYISDLQLSKEVENQLMPYILYRE